MNNINSPQYQLNENVKILQHRTLDNLIEGYPSFEVEIEGETRTYFFKYDGNSCECGQRHFMFGYLASNNGVNAYCIHCHKKSKLGVKQSKNKNSRTSNHLYYVDFQKDKNRFFCELCLCNNTPLNVHHIEEVQYGGSDDPDNLQLLCKPCHDVTHAVRTSVKRGL